MLFLILYYFYRFHLVLLIIYLNLLHPNLPLYPNPQENNNLPFTLNHNQCRLPQEIFYIL